MRGSWTGGGQERKYGQSLHRSQLKERDRRPTGQKGPDGGGGRMRVGNTHVKGRRQKRRKDVYAGRTGRDETS